MVEEFGMAREFSGLAEVIDGANDAFAEEIFPNTIGHDPGGERVLWIGDPFSEFEPAGMIGGDMGGCS